MATLQTAVDPIHSNNLDVGGCVQKDGLQGRLYAKQRGGKKGLCGDEVCRALWQDEHHALEKRALHRPQWT